jgi:hypothetical protein
MAAGGVTGFAGLEVVEAAPASVALGTPSGILPRPDATYKHI